MDVSAIFKASQQLHFAPSFTTAGAGGTIEADFPVRRIRKGQWKKVPVIVGGQSCESCHSALSAFGKEREVTEEHGVTSNRSPDPKSF